MKDLIPIQENNGKKAVSARDLHVFLESKQQFADWIKNRINQYDFIEDQDYVVFHNSMNNPSGGRPQIEYALTIDAAKELSMVEGNEKGKQARRYFIECEKVAKVKVLEAKNPMAMNANTLYTLRMKAVAWTAKMLNLSEESKLRMIQAVTDPLGLPSPNYVSSKGVMHSATYLLKERSNLISILRFNQKMIAAGYLEEKERPSKSKGVSRFKCLTEKGLIYGENEVCPKNALETQPHYYDDKFDELLEKLLVIQ
ncbi:antA/AntB antirepressor family protein [Bacteroides thetaiotaomicron]|jgi:phage anti-repressor protein|uniref:antA/AntB antirepressor family protein n=1 Tax=Bacteroides thetaiotaomicron TaxID=818 RepID=UPI0022E3059B|nr:antA/AntB antirepressor family protein [Bacteroides thetaiotaomicron]